MNIREESVPGYERVVHGTDEAVGYRGIVVVHSTALGPAVGGTRYWSYQSEDDALTDALRLARGMTYKNALAGLPCGGGKSIIMRSNKAIDREQLFRAHGRLVNTLAGKYVTAEDVGTSPADMEYILKETKHVAGLQGRSGDPSPHTARGVFRAMQAAAKHKWGSDDLSGKAVSIQGCGHVGYFLAGELFRAGAQLDCYGCGPGKSKARGGGLWSKGCGSGRGFRGRRYFCSMCIGRRAQSQDDSEVESLGGSGSGK